MGKTQQSFSRAGKRINALRKEIESGNPGVSGALVIAELVATDVRASRPGAGVPRDMGDLASTVMASGGGRGLVGRATVSAGGAAAPYAVIQHERTDYHHDLGEARYLVRALERFALPGSPAAKALKENAEAAVRNAAG